MVFSRGREYTTKLAKQQQRRNPTLAGSFEYDPHIRCSSASNMDVQLSRRGAAIAQLLNSQREFLGTLELASRYASALSQEMTQEEYAALFCNLDDMRRVNGIVLTMLLDYSRRDSHAGSPAGPLLRQAFELIAPDYINYCLATQKCQEYIEEICAQTPSFEDSMNGLQEEFRAKHTLLAVLTEPSRQAARFPQLVLDLARATPAGHADHAAMQAVYAMAHNLNRKTRRAAREATDPLSGRLRRFSKIELADGDGPPTPSPPVAKAAVNKVVSVEPVLPAEGHGPLEEWEKDALIINYPTQYRAPPAWEDEPEPLPELPKYEVPPIYVEDPVVAPPVPDLPEYNFPPAHIVEAEAAADRSNLPLYDPPGGVALASVPVNGQAVATAAIPTEGASFLASTDAFTRRVLAIFRAADQTDGTKTAMNLGPNASLDSTELQHRLNYGMLASLLADYGLLAAFRQGNNGQVDYRDLLIKLDLNRDGNISIKEWVDGFVAMRARLGQRRETQGISMLLEPPAWHHGRISFTSSLLPCLSATSKPLLT